MTELPPAPSPSIHDLHVQAQADAQRMFGEGPVPAWEPPRHESLPWLVPIGAGVAIAWFAATLAYRMQGPMPTPLSPVAPRAAVEEILEAAPSGAGARELPRSAVAAAMLSSLSIERVSQAWRVDAVAASRLEAARRLAALSGTTLHGPAELLDATRPLDLQWESRSLAQTWHALIGAHLNYILNCPRQRCEIWVLGTQPADGGDVPSNLGTAAITLLAAGPADDRIDDLAEGPLRD